MTTASSRRSGGTVSNIVPIRVRIDPTLRFDQVVRNVLTELIGALRHQRYRYEDMRRELAATGSVGTGFGPDRQRVMMFHEEIVFGDVVGVEFPRLRPARSKISPSIFIRGCGQSTRVDFEAESVPLHSRRDSFSPRQIPGLPSQVAPRRRCASEILTSSTTVSGSSPV